MSQNQQLKKNLTLKALILFIITGAVYTIATLTIQTQPQYFRAAGYTLLSIFIIIAITSAVKVEKKSKITESLRYAFIFLLIQSLAMILVSLNIQPQLFNLFNIFYLIGYFMFAVALYHLFRNVFFQTSNSKIAIAAIITLLAALLFTYYAQPLILSNAPLINKIFGLTSALIDVIVTTGLAILMIFLNSKLFIKVYKWALLAITLALVRDFIQIPSRLLETTYTWNPLKLAAFLAAMLAYISITHFLEQQNESPLSNLPTANSRVQQPSTR
jgi:hypothetical protein